jgi:hypothetical protein
LKAEIYILRKSPNRTNLLNFANRLPFDNFNNYFKKIFLEVSQVGVINELTTINSSEKVLTVAKRFSKQKKSF